MPLQSLQLQKEIVGKLQLKVKSLVKKHFLHPLEKIEQPYTIGFCMHIQVVPKKQIDFVAFGEPEGIRVFIQSDNNVLAAADFLFTKNGLKFSYLHYGFGLKILISALNKLEKKYSKKKDIYYSELLYFLLNKGTYILMKSRKEKQLFFSTPQKLTAISPERLKKQLARSLKNRDLTI